LVVAGFALPGLVIALSLVNWTLRSPILDRLYQTLPLLIFAYVVHFGAQAMRASQVAVDGVPRNDTLNAVSPNNPVSLGHASGHAAFFNDAALTEAGIDDDTPDPPGGTIVRTPEGKATGLMRETAQRLLNDTINEYNSRLTPEQAEQLDRERVMLAADEALRHGVTSFHDAGADFETIDFFKKLEAEGTLPVRLYVMVRRESNEVMAEALPHYIMVAEGNDFLTVRSIKRQIDGPAGKGYRPSVCRRGR
jgi:predicted amidohydrolase YtcJ